MSHVDEGILTAWLDGQADAIGADTREIESHVATCADCRALLDRLRTERDRSRAILRGSAPAAAPPAFADLVARARNESTRKQRRGLSQMASLAWAATMIVAVGIGWYAVRTGRPATAPTRPLPEQVATRRDQSPVVALPPEEPRDTRALARSAAGAAGGERRLADDARPRPAAPPAAAPAILDQPVSSLASVAEAKKEKEADELGKLSDSMGLKGQVAEFNKAAANADAVAPVPADAITLESATRRLGRPPLTVPSLPVVGYRSRGSSGIVVIQSLPNGVAVTLAQVRHAVRQNVAEPDRLAQDAAEAARGRVASGTAARALNEVAREATRAVDGIDVTASAPVSADSLAVLLRAVH